MARQACRYRGTRCAGCGEAFARGERVRGGGAGLVHDSWRCVASARQAVRGRGDRARESAASELPTVTADEARAASVWSRLEREFALSGERSAPAAGGLLLPRHDRATFIAFVRWMASDVERARSLDQVRIALRSVSPVLRLTDWCADAEIAGLMAQLEGRAAMASRDE